MSIIGEKVLFIGDFGIDDIVALLFASYSKEIDIVGIVVDYGNVSKENATKTATFIQEITGLTSIPIIGGAIRPLTGESPTYYPEIHGEYGMGPIVPKINDPISEFENFHQISVIINEYEDEVAIVNVGRLTSLATSFVLYPTLMSKVKDFYIMGGAFLYSGNATPVAEANFYSDQYAANLVLTYAEGAKIFPLNITNYAIIPEKTVTAMDKYFKSKDDQVGQLLKPMIDYYTKWYKERDPSISGGPLHDLLTLWSVANNHSFQFVKKPVKINTSIGEARGLSIGDFRGFNDLANYKEQAIAISFDYKHFLTDIVSTFTNGAINVDNNS